MYTATKRSSGDPYLPPKPNSKRLHAGLKPSKRKSRKSSSTDLLQPNDSNNNVSISTEDLSKDIALAVATIIAESKMLQDDEDTDGESNNNETESIIKGEKEELSRPTSSTVPSAQIHMSDSHASSSDSKLSLAKFENENTNGSLVTCIASETATSVRSHHLPSPPTLPKGARLGDFMELTKYFLRVQNYMNNLGYHREGEPKIRINPRLSMKMQMITAKEIIKAGVPIKCLHAVVVAVHFTNCTETVERFPIYFRSHVAGKEYKHIVLGMYVQGHFGALGISRDAGLQDKKAVYSKLSELIFEFAKCYDQSGHILNEVKFGNIITHDQHSLERLFSKIGSVTIHGSKHEDIESHVERMAKQLRAKMGLPCLKSIRLDAYLFPANSTRSSRSKTSIIGHNTPSHTRTLSMGPPPKRGSDESIKPLTRSKPPKTNRK